MNCWDCNRPAHGVCKFCGRAICKEHYSERINIVSDIKSENVTKVIITKKALYCGKCQPVGEPISIDKI